jgi:hypothetical protein
MPSAELIAKFDGQHNRDANCAFAPRSGMGQARFAAERIGVSTFRGLQIGTLRHSCLLPKSLPLIESVTITHLIYCSSHITKVAEQREAGVALPCFAATGYYRTRPSVRRDIKAAGK